MPLAWASLAALRGTFAQDLDDGRGGDCWAWKERNDRIDASPRCGGPLLPLDRTGSRRRVSSS
jgi:hypothetical protein